MKARTINAILTAKFHKFIDSIKDEEIREIVSNNSIITGGCIVSMLTKEKINDYDLYFRTKDAALAVAKHFVERFKNSPKFSDGRAAEIEVQDKNDRIHVRIQSAGIASETDSSPYEYFESRPEDEALAYVDQSAKAAEQDTSEEEDFRPVFLSSNAIMLSGGIQLIVRFFGEPDEIHANYDFAHCTNYWRSDSKTLHLNQRALEAILAKELFYIGSKYPLCSIIRTRKFIQRGWQINAGQYLKMALQLNEIKLTDPLILEEQLIGVDSAYFAQVIAAVKDLEPEKMNAAYLSAIIDRIF